MPTLLELGARGPGWWRCRISAGPRASASPISQEPLVEPLARRSAAEVAFAEDCIGPPAARRSRRSSRAWCRCWKTCASIAGEEANDPAFVKQLASLGELYVNDAFSAAHRAHASTVGVAHRCRGRRPADAGRARGSAGALENPERPVMAIVGGAKVSTKLELLGNLVGKVDCW